MNFRRILSKSSLKSSSSATEKSLCPSEEVSKLQSEVEFLKQTIESLKVSVESRDAAIGTLAREKEKLYVELKSAQRTNRNLHQELLDERDIHSKEKDFLVEEIKRLSESNSIAINEFHGDQNTLEAPSDSLPLLKEELKSRDEVIFNLCTKYFKIKTSKEKLQKKQEKLQQQSQQICDSIVLLLHENRRSLNSILRKLVKASSMPPSTKSYLSLLKVNANLHYENTQLKVCLSIKDFSCNREEESSKWKLTLKKAKSQNNARKPKYRVNQQQQDFQMDFKQSKMHKLEKLRKFGSIHTKFAPYFRRKRLYSSEPRLASFSYDNVNK